MRLFLLCCILGIAPALQAQSVAEEWAARYNAQGSVPTEAGPLKTQKPSIAVDMAGNSYVAGTRTDNATGVSSLVTIKYSPTGEQLWVSAYGNATASAIAVDKAGGVYVLGSTTDRGSDSDFVTVRYEAATGTQRWSQTYNGYNGGFQQGRDQASAITVDNQGGVYVTGTSVRERNQFFSTVRYEAATGAQSWSSTQGGGNRSYQSGARAIAVDNAGGVYVTGYGTFIPPNYAAVQFFFSTTRLDAVTGDHSWSSDYGSSQQSDFTAGEHIEVDNAGGVYVTGTTGNRNLPGDKNYTTLRLAAATGAQTWVSTYNGQGNGADEVRALAVDNAGGVYVTGTSLGTTATGSDYATVRYDAATGTQRWANRYHGPGNGPDQASALAVDNAGGVYVTGASLGATDNDYATVRYDAATGQEGWATRRVGPSKSSDDQAQALAVDHSGNLWVTGSSAAPATGSDIFTVKYRQAAPSNAYTFYRAINLNGPALTLDGHAWEGSGAPNYSTNGIRLENQNVPLIPATDAKRANMIRSFVYRPDNLRITLSAVPAGAYQVYLYVWEDNYAETFSLSLNGQVVSRNYHSGPAGTWVRLGPYPVTADGSIQLVSSGGTANISGIELWKKDTTPPANPPGGGALQAQVFPNPSANGRFVLLLPDAWQGEVTYRLVSALGTPLQTGTISPSSARKKVVELNFSSRMTTTGVYYLLLNHAQEQTQLRLLRE